MSRPTLFRPIIVQEPVPAHFLWRLLEAGLPAVLAAYHLALEPSVANDTARSRRASLCYQSAFPVRTP